MEKQTRICETRSAPAGLSRDGRSLARLFARGIESAELRLGLDPDIVLDALYGPFYHRLLMPYENAAMSDAFIDALVDTVFGGLQWF
jgi:hypothetical protein